MKKSIIIVGVLVAITISSNIFVSSCTSKKNEQHQTEINGHQNAPGEEHKGMEMDSTGMDHQQLVYSCPMHPEITGTEGDTCSICGMKLEAAESSDGAEMHQNN